MLLQFSATWCGPCKQIKPFVRKAVDDKDGALAWCTVDIDNFPQIAQSMQVTHVPMIFAVRDKTVVAKYPGGATQQAIDEYLMKV